MTSMRMVLAVLAVSVASSATALAGNGDQIPPAPTCTCRTPELGEELLYVVRRVIPFRMRTPELGEELLWQRRTPELGEELVPATTRTVWRPRTPELGDELLTNP